MAKQPKFAVMAVRSGGSVFGAKTTLCIEEIEGKRKVILYDSMEAAKEVSDKQNSTTTSQNVSYYPTRVKRSCGEWVAVD